MSWNLTRGRLSLRNLRTGRSPVTTRASTFSELKTSLAPARLSRYQIPPAPLLFLGDWSTIEFASSSDRKESVLPAQSRVESCARFRAATSLFFDNDWNNYYLIWIFTLGIMLLSINLSQSRIGRALRAIRSEERRVGKEC